MGAGLLAADVEEDAVVDAEEDGKPGFSFGLAASLSVSSPADSAEDTEGTLGTTALGRVTSTVP